MIGVSWRGDALQLGGRLMLNALLFEGRYLQNSHVSPCQDEGPVSRDLTGPMLFGMLLAGLGWFANLLANRLPLVVLVFLDGIQQGLALWQSSWSASGVS